MYSQSAYISRVPSNFRSIRVLSESKLRLPLSFGFDTLSVRFGRDLLARRLVFALRFKPLPEYLGISLLASSIVFALRPPGRVESFVIASLCEARYDCSEAGKTAIMVEPVKERMAAVSATEVSSDCRPLES